MFKLKCPIPFVYLRRGQECYINQLFGENKNMTLSGGVKYGPEGHTGIDFDTTDTFKYIRQGLHTFDEDAKPVGGSWLRVPREKLEADGRIHIYACHEGYLSYVLNPDKQRQGWGMYVTADPIPENGKTTQYRTMYWHIETPWDGLQMYAGAVMTSVLRQRAKTGQIIAIAGNNGMANGPHLHLELQRRIKKDNGLWGDWERIDPMPYFDTPAIVYHRWYGGEYNTWMYQGQEVARTFIDSLTKNWPKTTLV